MLFLYRTSYLQSWCLRARGLASGEILDVLAVYSNGVSVLRSRPRARKVARINVAS